MSSPGLSQPTPQPVNQPDPLPTASAAARAAIDQTLKRSAGWFYWIGGLSLVNTVTILTGSSWVFLAGLGITAFAASLGKEGGNSGQAAAVIINTIAAAGFAFMGYLGSKGKKPAFILGMTLYTLDALLLLVGQLWLMVAFHGYVLYRLYQGYRSCSELHAFDQAAIPGAPIVPQ